MCLDWFFFYGSMYFIDNCGDLGVCYVGLFFGCCGYRVFILGDEVICCWVVGCDVDYMGVFIVFVRVVVYFVWDEF